MARWNFIYFLNENNSWSHLDTVKEIVNGLQNVSENSSKGREDIMSKHMKKALR